MITTELFFVLIPYLLIKGLIIWGESPEFDDFPAALFLGLSLVATYALILYNGWNLQSRILFPLLAISSLQLVSVKDGTYNGFLQTSVAVELFIVGILLNRGLKLDITTLGLGVLAASTGITILQSL